MELQINTSSPQPIYRQLADQIQKGVAQGRLQPGTQLPSVRELSRRLVVNPNTIAKAYRELEHAGIVRARRGTGVFVAEPHSDLTKTARKKQLAAVIDRLLTEAVYLGFRRDEVLQQLADRADRFEWRSES